MISRDSYFQSYHARASKQHGAALLVGLLLLVVLTLIAVVGMNRATLQERLAGGVRNATMSHYGAEATLRDAEFRLFNHMTTLQRIPRGTDAPFLISESESTAMDVGNTVVRDYRATNGWITSPISAAYPHGFDAVGDSALAENPEFIVEYIGDLPVQKGDQHTQFDSGNSGGAPRGATGNLHFYRITARSTGGTENLVRVLESIYVIGE